MRDPDGGLERREDHVSDADFFSADEMADTQVEATTLSKS